MVEKKRRLTREDWTAAALDALAEGGLAAVAIEPLAARLGATKGSAYWHFPNREALLVATLERWENEHTEAVIAATEAESEPVAKLRLLYGSAIVHASGNLIVLALLGAVNDPVVAPFVRRVNRRWLSYLAGLYRDMGLRTKQARRRALLAYSAYLGLAQLAVSSPESVPSTKAARIAYVEEAVASLGARTGVATA
ncbi:MAG: TetR/AcrR family transcriptional regulator [Sciscionella sp.]